MLSAQHGDLLLQCLDLHAAAFLFVGDDAQLPPVGAGELLRPLMQAADLPCLTENLRASEGVLQQQVLDVRCGRVRESTITEHFCRDEGELVRKVLEGNFDFVLAFRNDERYLFNAACIARDRKLDATAVAALPSSEPDDYLALAFALRSSRPRAYIPYVGLPVRFETNEHKPLAFRGTLGRLCRAHSPRRGFWHLDVELADARIVHLEVGHFQIPEHITPAYALTVHDAQGAQRERIAVLFPPSASCPLLSLEALYTAVSRAQCAVCFFTYRTPLVEMLQHFERPSRLRTTPLNLLLTL